MNLLGEKVFSPSYSSIILAPPLMSKTFKCLFQHSLKASFLQCLALFRVQLSYPYMTTGKNHSFDYMDLCW